jgi:hypothetical protein
MARLKDQRFKHQHVIKRRPPAPRSIRTHNGALEIGTEQFKIDHGAQPFQGVALSRQLLQPLLDVEKTRLHRHRDPPLPPTQKPAIRAQIQPVFRALQLADPETVVAEQTKHPPHWPRMLSGTQPLDYEQYVLSDDQKNQLFKSEPRVIPFIRPYIGSDGFINGDKTCILALQDASPGELRAIPEIRRRMHVVSEKHTASKRDQTKKIADTPTLYNVTVIPSQPFLVVPKVSSERREYVPIAFLEPPTIPSDLVFVIKSATPALFGLITSRMHMAWLRYIGGRLKSDYRYSIGLVYNPFPWPEMSPQDEARIAQLANGVLAARRAHPNDTLADLYDPATMPPDLRKAHQALDVAVDRLYRREPFRSDRERAEFLLARYEAIHIPLVPAPPLRGRQRRGRVAA